MSPKSFDMSGYVEVSERIAEFRRLYPDGALQAEILPLPDAFAGKFIAMRAYAYRSIGDPRPGIGHAWEPVPGVTPYTKDSELMNCETSAWGRAIVAALATDAKRGIASANEVRNRKGSEPRDSETGAVRATDQGSVHLSGGSGSDEPGSPPAQGPPESLSEAGETFASPSPAGAMAAAQHRQAPSASGRGTANPAPDVRRGTASEHRSGAGTKISAESPGNVEPEALAPEPLSAGADTPGGEGSAITEPGPSPSGSFPPSERATLPQMRELVIVFGSQKDALKAAAKQLGRSFGKLDDLSSEEANTLLFSEAAKP